MRHYKPIRQCAEGTLLVVLPSKYVGNMVISLQTLASITRQNESATLLIDGNFEPLVRTALGEAVRLVSWPRGKKQRIRRVLAFIAELRRVHYDEIVDLDGTVLSGRATRLARGGRKTGPSFAKRSGAYDRIIAIDCKDQHCFDDYVQMAASVGVTVDDSRYLQLPRATTGRLPFEPDPARPIVCLHPSATKDYKQWHIDRFAELADRLAERGCQVVVIGAGDGERARVERLLAGASHPIVNTHDRLTLTDLVYLFQQAHLYIGNDSGPMHLAAASGINVIALFGPTEQTRWQPRVEAADVVKGSALCAPDCRTEDCKRGYQCLTSLTVNDVVSRAQRVLETW